MEIHYHYPDEVLRLSSQLTEAERQAYVNRVYRFLMEMKPGTRVQVDRIARPDTRELFVEVVKMAILESFWDRVEFSADYQTMRKLACV